MDKSLDFSKLKDGEMGEEQTLRVEISPWTKKLII